MNKTRIQSFPKIIFTDFDGCLTDDRVWLNEEGEEFVAANRKDGLAIKKLINHGIDIVITSTETNKVVSARADKLGIEVLQGLSCKSSSITQYLEQRKLGWADVWYVGNDVNDLIPITRAKLSLCPSDAVLIIRDSVDVILSTRGGYGIFAEILNEIICL
jgi:YrbI family 3-deoxy-D-manno-octulosonate 8-phosphate phosphatase